jgi:hypothetical protein
VCALKQAGCTAPDSGVFILEPGSQGSDQTGCTAPDSGIFILEPGSQASDQLRVLGIQQCHEGGGSQMEVSGAKNVRQKFRRLFASHDSNGGYGCAGYLRFLIIASFPQGAERTRMFRHGKGLNSA